MISVVAAIIKKNDTYFLARRAAHKEHAGKWEFPGGKLNEGESPEEALERELFEEFGVVTKTGKHVVTRQYNYGTFQIELMAYEVTYIGGAFQLTDHDQIAWVPLEKIKQYELSLADVSIYKAL